MLNVRSRELAKLVKPDYTLRDVQSIEQSLLQTATLSFPALNNGLFPASVSSVKAVSTGYENVWIRDNTYVALAHYGAGFIDIAISNTIALLEYFGRHRSRFADIIHGRADPGDPMCRPHIRFDGNTLAELSEQWPHAQNDALGYFLWFYTKLASKHVLRVTQDNCEVLALFINYFETIGYWQDEDSGHWEEVRRVGASSIGVVVAALEKTRELMLNQPRIAECLDRAEHTVTHAQIDRLIGKGREALMRILPFECVQPAGHQRRLHDAALLFLMHPLDVVDFDLGAKILDGVATHLQGDHGIRRYIGDSYWSPDYKRRWLYDQVENSGREERACDCVLALNGREAQWCLFDPAVSTIYGTRYERTRENAALHKQIEYFNRALSQITGEDAGCYAHQCPELYYFEGEKYVPNDNTPLLWTAANLWVALEQLKRNLSS